MPAAPYPARFSRRLSIAFVLVAGLSAGALALGAGISVTSQRHASFRDRARQSVLSDLRLLSRGSGPELIAARLENREQPGAPGVVIAAGGTIISSVERLDVGDVPADLRAEAEARAGELVEGNTTLDGDPYLVIGAAPDEVDADLYWFFPQRDLRDALREMRNALVLGWLAVLAVSGFVGNVVAKRTLRPVRTAAAAAQSVTEGLLETRLPVAGDDEFGRLAASFNEMVAAVEEKIAALAEARDRESRFNADVAHELRTPLGALVTAASLLEARSDDLPVDLRRPVQIVVEGARRLHRLADELLELHRLEVGTEEALVELVDLSEAARASVRAHGWEDDVVVETPDAPVTVETDRHRLERILVNLLANALEHGGAGVRVRVAVEGADAVLAVSDQGLGIHPAELPHLFDRYYKVSRSRTGPQRGRASSGGSGLGLAIVAENARVLGGRIEAASEPGRGAVFTLRLPLPGGVTEP